MTNKFGRNLLCGTLLLCSIAARADVVGTFTSGGFTSGTFNGALGQAVIGRSPDKKLQSGLFVAAPAPTVSTNAATAVGAATATLNATINPGGLATTAKFEYGLTDSYGSEKTITLAPNNGATDQNVSAVLSGLEPLTTYYFRASATNSEGTTLGIDRTFTTLETPSLIVTTTDDDSDATDGDTSLREAIAFANSNADMSTVEFDRTVRGIIQLTAKSDMDGDVQGIGDSAFALTQSTTISGPGANVLTVRRDTGGNYRPSSFQLV